MKFSENKIYFKSQRKRICYGIFLLLIICGIILGSVMISTADSLMKYQRLLFNHNIFKSKTEISAVIQFFRSFAPVVFLLAVQLFSGYSAFGQVFAAVTLIYRGAACGIASSFTYLILGVKGIPAILVMILPFAAATAAVLIIGARESFRQSGRIAEYAFFNDRSGDEPPSTKLYLLKFGVLGVFSLIISVADTIITYFLKDIFF